MSRSTPGSGIPTSGSSARISGAPGAAVLAGMEGQRPMLIEIQALVAPTRLHQLDSIFAIFGSVLGSKPLYFRVGQVENRL
jgi:hypothetical protein